ncbi:poly(U)-specific 3'-to-5' RNA exonuclease [Tulasnella sp. 417]|nr:poly(U)-specific 3'-to-5' RNA exonuclease [Tulasnella sp. 417]
MKRTLVDVDYGSSDEEAEPTPAPEQKKRFGHASKKLYGTIVRLVDRIRDVVPEMHSLVANVNPPLEGLAPLHISLSRPIYLRAHHREDFRIGVQSAARAQNQFPLSFASISSFINDDRTRIFISVEVGAGHTQLKQLTDSLTPSIKKLHQEPYYSTPRFHFSVAWALLKVEQPPSNQDEGEALDEGEETGQSTTFPSISDIPESLLNDLNKEFGREIREGGNFMAEAIELKIGKVISTFKLK